ncbi:MAG: rhomboid family intramembrane serine protease [Verrucomicrobiales bacterium]|nr:rhomboid family intramembrane serine protease [Verrucomicrobiales bacterium]
MSSYDRDYMRHEPRRGPTGPSTWSVVTWLLVINVAVYLVNNLLFFNPNRDVLKLSVEALKEFHLWTPITFQFVHADFLHLIGNMLYLFFFGRVLVKSVKKSDVLKLYLLGGLTGAALEFLWSTSSGPVRLIGSSGSVLAITIALTTLLPFQRVHLFGVFSVTFRQIAWALVALNVLRFLFTLSGAPTTGESREVVGTMAHFGGMFFGWLYIRRRWHEAPARSPRPKRSGFGVRILRDDPPKPASPPPPKPAGKKAPFVTSDVDAILDKINEQGFQSLTEEEHRILQESSGKISRRIDGD